MMPKSEYIETRNGGWYLSGSRIGLDVVVQAFRRGRTAEDIFRSFPSIGSLAKVYGVLTFILEHPQEIEAYLREENRFYEEFQAAHPLPAEMAEPFQRASSPKSPKIA
jgi:uncharacterized protein (DUF433 family)